MSKNYKCGIIVRLKRKTPQIPKLLSNFPRFLGFWEFPNHEFLFPICYRISLDLGNFHRSGTTGVITVSGTIGKVLRTGLSLPITAMPICRFAYCRRLADLP
jgi:hypothetical protein